MNFKGLMYSIGALVKNVQIPVQMHCSINGLVENCTIGIVLTDYPTPLSVSTKADSVLFIRLLTLELPVESI